MITFYVKTLHSKQRHSVLVTSIELRAYSEPVKMYEKKLK